MKWQCEIKIVDGHDDPVVATLKKAGFIVSEEHGRLFVSHDDLETVDDSITVERMLMDGISAMNKLRTIPTFSGFSLRMNGLYRIDELGSRVACLHPNSTTSRQATYEPWLRSSDPQEGARRIAAYADERGDLYALSFSNPTVRQVLLSLHRAELDPGDEFNHLWEVFIGIKKDVRTMEDFRRRIDINVARRLRVDGEKFMRLRELLHLPVRQGRKRSLHDELRDATNAELQEARQLTGEIVSAWLRYRIKEPAKEEG